MNGKRNRESRRKNHYTAIWLPCVITAVAVTFLLWGGNSAGEEAASDSQAVQGHDIAGEDSGSAAGGIRMAEKRRGRIPTSRKSRW